MRSNYATIIAEANQWMTSISEFLEILHSSEAERNLWDYRQFLDDLTAPRHLKVTHEGQYSLAIKWDAPECGSIGEYQVWKGVTTMNAWL